MIAYGKDYDENGEQIVRDQESKPAPPRWVPLSQTPEARSVEWLRFGLLARGHVTNLFGDEGIGKSLWWVHTVAGLTREGAKVAVVVTEDGLEDTVKSRLLAAEAVIENILVLNIADELDDFELGIPHPNTELDMLPDDVSLIVIDAFLDTINGNAEISKPAVCRQVFKPWKQFARRRDCAVLTITHTNRDRSNGTRGALGAAGTIRAVVRLNVLAQVDEQGLLAVGLEKTNLCPITNVTLYGHEQVQMFNATATSDGMVGRLVDHGLGKVTAKALFDSLAAPEPPSPSRLGDMAQRVLETVTEEVTPAAVAEKIDGLDNNAAGQYLRRLADRGLIENPSRGRFGPIPSLNPSLGSSPSGSDGSDGTEGKPRTTAGNPSLPSDHSLPEVMETGDGKGPSCSVCGAGPLDAEDAERGSHVMCEPPGGLSPDSPGQTDRVAAALAAAREARS